MKTGSGINIGYKIIQVGTVQIIPAKPQGRRYGGYATGAPDVSIPKVASGAKRVLHTYLIIPNAPGVNFTMWDVAA